jgi:hypothetical protein
MQENASDGVVCSFLYKGVLPPVEWSIEPYSHFNVPLLSVPQVSKSPKSSAQQGAETKLSSQVPSFMASQALVSKFYISISYSHSEGIISPHFLLISTTELSSTHFWRFSHVILLITFLIVFDQRHISH